MEKNKSFTLIELLVVIAIIGLLASIVVVNVNSARQKAQIAKAVSFSQQIYRALGSEAVGAWDFNEIVGGQVRDISGNGNVGTVNGATLVDSLTFSEGNFGKALSFDGADDYVNVPNSASLQIGPNFTVEAWFLIPQWSAQPEWCSTIAGQYTGADQTGFLLDGMKSTKNFRFVLNPGAGEPSVNTSAISEGQWHHIIVTVDTTNMIIYVDGAFNNSAASGGGMNPSIRVLRIGLGCYYLNGLIDEVRVYSKALSQAQIQQRYAEGLPRHQLVKY